MRRVSLLLLCALLLTACAVPGPGAAPRPGSSLEGSWGGAHVALILTPVGGSIEYDCAHGMLDAAVVPDAAGAFAVAGRHVREGGPVHAGDQLPSQPAVYAGRVSGERMQLRVRVGADTLGPFALQRGASAQLMKCL